ncbi:MAG: DUF3696 domain-containing protein [Bryobacteraceae bacterium]|jgi:predicted ATPase
MLNSLHLGNFKAFGETQEIPIKPLTLIFGANSAGKSTLLHGLLLACEANLTGNYDAYETKVGGKSVDLGGFRQYVYRRDLSRRVQWSLELDATRFTGRLAELLRGAARAKVTTDLGLALDDLGRPQPEAVPEIVAYDLGVDGKSLLRMSGRPDGSLQLDKLDRDHPVLRELLTQTIVGTTTTETVTGADWETVTKVIDELVPKIKGERSAFSPAVAGVVASGEPGILGPAALPLIGLAGGATLATKLLSRLKPVSRGSREEDLANAIELYLPRLLAELQGGIAKAVATELARVQYLGPVRFVPPRHLGHAEPQDPNWVAGGGKAWETLLRNEEVRNHVNAWLRSQDGLQSRYEVVVREYLAADELRQPLSEALKIVHENAEQNAKEIFSASLDNHVYHDPEGEISLFDPDEHAGHIEDWLRISDADRVRDLMLFDLQAKTFVSHRDVGFGISQVLPVLVYCFASKDMILAMEQPEIHLHPALQAELGDVFIESALKGHNTLLLETHSEHLILRIMRRMRETFEGKLKPGVPPVNPSDVSILFVERGPAGSTVREMPLNERGELLKSWPGGFFEEGLREVFPQ